jgi:hypothetical protein
MKSKNRKHRQGERGIALITVLLALLLLSVMALGAMYMTNMETGVNANFRTQQVAYFAARAGMEEVRVRMRKADPNSLYPLLSPGAPYDIGMVRGALTFVPANNNQAILYVLNEGNQPGSVQPWNLNNAYVDDELCHEGYTLPGLQAQNSVDYSVRCTSVPNGNNWYQTAVSKAPWNGTSAALTWKWVRVALKLNGSQQNYPVDAPQLAAGNNSPVCYNGTNELTLAGFAQCYQMLPTNNQTFLITVLAITPSGARRMVQSEVALAPSQPFPYGLFATGQGCGSLSISGGSTTDGYYSANGPYGGANQSNYWGAVGSNGNVYLGGTGGGTSVGGLVGSGPNLGAAIGACTAGPPLSGDAITTSGAQTGVFGTTPGNPPPPCQVPAIPNQNCIQVQPTTTTVTAPPPPSPLPPTGNVIKNGGSLTPGTYADLMLKGAITLAPGTYNVNSVVENAGATITVSPPGAVIFNVAGTGIAPSAKVVDLTGGSMTNDGVPKDFQINYAGPSKVEVGGNSSTYMLVNAPNATVDVTGNGNFFGAAVGAQINMNGGATFHFDLSSASITPSNGYYTLLAFRESFY